MIQIDRDDPARADVHQLLSEHLADMFATSPVESVHALDHSALSGPSISFWTARGDGKSAGVRRAQAPAFLIRFTGTWRDQVHAHNGKGSGAGRGHAMLRHILDGARTRNLERVLLETGSEDYFAPARRLYARHGFTECPPFADNVPDPNSVFMELRP